MKWALLTLVAAAIGASFFVRCEDEADAGAAGKRGRAAPVVVVPVTARPIIERTSYPGELDADSADIAVLYSGRLDTVNVRLGDVVAEGDTLATIRIVDLSEQRSAIEAQVRAARAEAQRVKAQLDDARREAERLTRLGEAALVASQEAESARARARALAAESSRAAAAASEAAARLALLGRHESESTVVAPFAGRVVDRYVDPGGYVTAGTRLVRLVSGGPLRVRFEVPEQDVAHVTVGAEVEVKVPAQGDDGVAARVTGVGGEVMRARRVVMAEALLEHHPESWLSGMFAVASVVRARVEDRPVVPAEALVTRMQPGGVSATGVFVRAGDLARWVPVEIAARESGRVAVRGELAVGAEVLVQGHQDLADGTPISVSVPLVRPDSSDSP